MAKPESKQRLGDLPEYSKVPDLLSRHFAGTALPFCREVVVIKTTETLQSVLREMAQRTITAMPVFHDTMGKFWGMLTLLDIISFCLGFGKDEKAVDVPGLLNKTVADACAARGKDWGPTCLVYVNTSLQDCWEIMTTLQTDYLMVVESSDTHIGEKSLQGVLSKDAIFRVAASMLPQLSVNRRLSVTKMRNLSRPVPQIDSSFPAIEAFRAVCGSQRKCVAIKHHGLLTRDLNEYQVTGLTGAHLDMASQPIRSLLRKLDSATQSQRVSKVQTCSAETTLDDLVQLFMHGGHRIVHVLDAVQACIASVTLDDVINELLRF